MNRELKFRGFQKIDKVMVYDLNSPRLLHGKLISEDDDYILMQYIGINDKNGKEIYEGDIIKDSYYDNKGKISFANCCYGIFAGKSYDGDILFYAMSKDLEVIGNIHENPELLGK